MRTIANGLVWALAALGLAALATGAFIVSYGAIHDVWISLEAGSVASAAVVPLLIDGFIVLVSLVGVANSLSGRPIRYPMALVALASGVSVSLNVAHADRTWGASLLAAVPSLVLVAAVELFVRELRHVLTRAAAREPERQPAALSGGQRLAIVDTDEPDRTVEMLPATATPSVVNHVHVSALSAARADAASAADTGAETAALTVDTTAGTSTRALVAAAWQRLEVEDGQHLSAAALARTLTAQRGQRVPEGTVRAELARLRGTPAREELT